MVGSHARFWRILSAVSSGILPSWELLATFSLCTSIFAPDLGASSFFHQTWVVFFQATFSPCASTFAPDLGASHFFFHLTLVVFFLVFELPVPVLVDSVAPRPSSSSGVFYLFLLTWYWRLSRGGFIGPALELPG